MSERIAVECIEAHALCDSDRVWVGGRWTTDWHGFFDGDDDVLRLALDVRSEPDPTIDEAVNYLRELSSSLLHFYGPDKEQPPHVAAVERICSDLRNLGPLDVRSEGEERLRSALAELVRLKEIKNEPRTDDERLSYEIAKEDAWQAARGALSNQEDEVSG